jgi:hypothetical protein
MAAPLVAPFLQLVDANGHPYAGGTINTYVPSTTTPKTTWADAGATAANTNPIVLDAAGRADVFGDGLYRLVIRDAGGAQIFDGLASSLSSTAMAPVLDAATLASARDEMGVTVAIAAAVLAETQRAEGAESTEAGARLSVDVALQAQRNHDIAYVNSQDAGLQAQIDALPGAGFTNVKGGLAQVDGTGHVRLWFSPAYTTLDAFVTTYKGGGFASVTVTAAADHLGADVWITRAGGPIPMPFEYFYWMSLGA